MQSISGKDDRLAVLPQEIIGPKQTGENNLFCTCVDNQAIPALVKYARGDNVVLDSIINEPRTMPSLACYQLVLRIARCTT